MATQAQLNATEKYRKQNIKSFTLKFFPADQDLYEFLQQQPKKAEYLRDLIRKDMQNS